MHDRVLSKPLTSEDETNYTESLFETTRHVNEYGQEFWYAREMQIALEYKQWRRFCNVIDKSKTACEGSGNTVSDHFADVGKMVNKGKENANRTHYEVGHKVRETIKDLGGTMPEDLPTPTKSIQQIEREQRYNLPE